MSRLRSKLFSIFMPAAALVIAVMTLPSLLRRDWATAVSKFWASTSLRGLKWICGIDARVLGAENLPASPAIIAAKHQSMWETLYLTALLPSPVFVLKKELQDIPVFGWWCTRSGFIFVDRAAGAKALRQMVADAQRVLADGASHLIIFPEGTRVETGDRTTYQPGVAALARATNLPIVPTAHNSGTFWRHHEGDKRPGTISLSFLSPLPATMPRAQLMETLETRIENATAALEKRSPADFDEWVDEGFAHDPSPESASHG